MKTLKKLWNWRPEPGVMKTARARAIRALAAFLALMVCCTLVARAADSMTVPVVSVDTPKRSSLSNSFTVGGMLETAGGVPATAPADLPVTEVLVALGDVVEEGDLLFTLDITQAQRDIAAKQLSLQALRLELGDMQQRLEQSGERGETDLERALEDYDAVEAAWELRLQEAGERRRTAQVSLMKYDGINRRDYDDDEFTLEEYNRLRSEYRSAMIAYEQAEAEREEALRGAQRKVDDLEDTVPEPDSSPAIKSLDIRRTELELAALNEAVAGEGMVYAPEGGIITRLEVEAGGRTSAAAQVMISREDSLHFAAEITAGQRESVAPGDIIDLTLSGETRGMDAVVASILPVTDKPDTFAMTVELPEGTGEPGRSASARITRRTGVYDSCVPLSALYGTEGDYYVLGVRETETTLGTEYVADKLPVALLEKSGSMAAVNGPLTQETKIIVGGDKAVREGDRIRLPS